MAKLAFGSDLVPTGSAFLWQAWGETDIWFRFGSGLVPIWFRFWEEAWGETDIWFRFGSDLVPIWFISWGKRGVKRTFGSGRAV